MSDEIIFALLMVIVITVVLLDGIKKESE